MSSPLKGAGRINVNLLEVRAVKVNVEKIMPILLIICICLTLGGCSSGKAETGLPGREQIEALRAEAAGWQSGRYLFTDLQTGEMDQAFSFMYNADGTQTYLYERVINGNYHAEYNGGGMIYIIDGEGLSVINSGSADYVSYDRENPHPYSTGDLLFYVRQYIVSSEQVTDEQGNCIYGYEYDTEKMNKAIGTSLTEFSTAYTFDAEGNFLYFTQSNSDGEGVYSYRIEPADINSVTEIQNPAEG